MSLMMMMMAETIGFLSTLDERMYTEVFVAVAYLASGLLLLSSFS